MHLDEHDLAYDDRAGEIRSFGAHITNWMLVVDIPIGEPCHICKVEITPFDVGHTQVYVGETTCRIAVHRACFLWSIGCGPKPESVSDG